jgi:HEPN domain-containing protein
MLKSGGTAAITAETYIDLLIIMSDSKDVPLTELEPVFNIASLKYQRVCCSLHSADRVKECIERGNIFYSLNCIDKNLVYDDKRFPLPTTTAQALRNMKLQAEVAFTLCFKKAVSFYQSAVFLHENNPEPVIAFYLHQAVELTYRAILRCLNGYYKKTHVIRSLKDLARRCAPQLNAIFPDNTGQEKHLLDILENAYLNARYDNQYNIDDKHLILLFERAKQVLDIAQEMKEQAIAEIPESE